MEERDRYDEKLERILRASSRIFAEKGYHRASIRDIASATGISVSGLYYYFGSKEELLFLIQRHCFGAILERLREDLDGVSEPEQKLRVLVRNHLRFFVSNMAEMKVLSHEADALTGEYRERIRRQKREYTSRAYGILRELGPEADAVDLRVATFSLFGMLNWIYNWYQPGRDVDVDRLADGMLHLFLEGYREPAVGDPAGGEPAAGADSSLWPEGGTP